MRGEIAKLAFINKIELLNQSCVLAYLIVSIGTIDVIQSILSKALPPVLHVVMQIITHAINV